jgi:Fe-S cluster biogenesis protein NfuA
MPEETEFQRRLQSVERLVGEIEGAADPHMRATVRELVQTIMDLHSSGLERMLELVGTAEPGTGIIQRLGRDELVGSLLILYNLHPVDLPERVAQGVDKARSRLRAYEGEVELLSIQEGAVRIRVSAQQRGCGSSPGELKEIVEQAIYQSAPDVTAVVVEEAANKTGFVPLSAIVGSTSMGGMLPGIAPAAGYMEAVSTFGIPKAAR